MEQTNYNFDNKEIGEIYNALCCFYVFCRDKKGMKRRAKFISDLRCKVYELMD